MGRAFFRAAVFVWRPQAFANVRAGFGAGLSDAALMTRVKARGLLKAQDRRVRSVFRNNAARARFENGEVRIRDRVERFGVWP